MIDKIRQVVSSAYNIESINSDISKSSEKIDEFISKMETLTNSINVNFETQKSESIQLTANYNAMNHELRKLKEEFERELNEFKVLKTQLRTEIIERVSEDIKKEMNIYIMNVKQNVEKLNETIKDLKTVSELSKTTCSAIENIREISKNIKKEDFELTKYAQILEKGDREKIELLRKIDTMEKLVGQRRRENSQRQSLY